MRILLTTDTVGGVWNYTATLARELDRRGHSLLIAVVGEPAAEQLDQLPSGVSLDHRPDALEWLLAPVHELRSTAEWIRDIERDWNADVVHLNQMAYTGLTRFSAPTLVAVHSDACSWFSEVLRAPPPPEWNGYMDSVRAGLHAATCVVAPSRYQADLVRRHFGRGVDQVIHNAAPAPSTPPPARSGRDVIAVGRAWDEAKGMAVLDRAISILGAHAPVAHLLGPTHGPNRTHFSGTAVTLHGRVPAAEVAEWMSAASIYVAPSLYEPFGLAPLEAALRGCALVLSDIGSFRELWGDAATYFPSGNAPALARTIEELIADDERVAALADAARARALAEFGLDDFGAKYSTLYRTLIRRPGNAYTDSRETDLGLSYTGAKCI